eukprot:jgi/Botrbrau1/17693/Bobra.0166s0117.1
MGLGRDSSVTKWRSRPPRNFSLHRSISSSVGSVEATRKVPDPGDPFNQWRGATVRVLPGGALKQLTAYLDMELGHLAENLQPQLFQAALGAVWAAVLRVMEQLVLGHTTDQRALSDDEATALEETVIALREYFHAEGRGPPTLSWKRRQIGCGNCWTTSGSLTQALEDAYDELWDAQNRNLLSGGDDEVEESSSPPRAPNSSGAWPGREEDDGTEHGVGSRRGGVGSRRPTVTDSSEGNHSAQTESCGTGGTCDAVTLLDLLRLLHQRRHDPAAQELVALRVPHAASHVMQVVFGLGKEEEVLAWYECMYARTGRRGCLYISSGHLGFTALGYDLQLASDADNTLLLPLARVARMTKLHFKRLPGLAFALMGEATMPHIFFDFSSNRRDEVEHTIRMHVMGDGSQLDLGLRGLAAPASATGLALPAGEAVARSYECQLFGGGIFPPWGQLHLCSSVVLFDSDECPRRLLYYKDIISVSLSRNMAVLGVTMRAESPGPEGTPVVTVLRLISMPQTTVDEIIAETNARVAEARRRR